MKNAAVCIIFLLFTAICATSCHDEEKDVTRNFMPVNIKVEQKGFTSIEVSWEIPVECEKYTVQLAEDSLFTNIIDKQTTPAKSYKYAGLNNNFTYYIRVRAENQDQSGPSQWQQTEFIFSRDKIVTDISTSSCTAVVSLNLQVGETDSLAIRLTKEGTDVTTAITIERHKDNITIKDLEQSSLYNISLLQDGFTVEEYAFATKGSNEREKPTYITVTPDDNIQNVIDNSADGATINFTQGIYAYGDKQITIENKSLIFESAATDRESLPEIHFKSFSLKGNVEKIIFRNIGISGFAFGGKSPEQKNSYFIDLTSDFTSADTVMIEGCTIHYLNFCVIRGSRGKGMQKIKYIGFRNCEIYDINSIGDNQYEMLKLDSLQLNKIELTNCTIYNVSHGLINNRNNHAASLEAVIRNCTINDFGSTSHNPKKYLLNFTNTNARIVIENDIFSNLKGYDGSETYMSKGFTLGDAKSYANNNLFHHMPFTVSEATNWTECNNNLDDVNPQYADPETGDFTIGNSTLLHGGKNGMPIGDPRWCK